jgi:ABC-type dipeptide/oligopeptide/nickel transport system permease subunit
MADLLTSAPALASLPTVVSNGGFSWFNLVVVLVLAAIAWPIYRRMRASISRGRRERWAREENWSAEITPETDPDLRRDEPPAPGDRP